MSSESLNLMQYALGIGATMISLSFGIFASLMSLIRETGRDRRQLRWSSVVGLAYLVSALFIYTGAQQVSDVGTNIMVALIFLFGPITYFNLMLGALTDLSRSKHKAR